MRYFNKKSKNNRGIVGITGALLVILGVGSLIFQSSTTVNVYAQVGVGPWFKIGPPDHSNGQNSESDNGGDSFLVYKDRDADNVYLAKIVGKQAQQDEPKLIISGGTGPAVDVTPGGQVKVAAEQQGEIAFVGCADDDDKCTLSKIISNPTTGPPVGIEGEGGEDSCVDDVDNDGDNRIDIADTDCKWSSEQESSMRGLCSDGRDNDRDGVTDSDDEDCRHPSVTTGAEDSAEAAGAERTRETTGAEDSAEAAGAEDNDTGGVEPTSFNLQPGTTTSSPQLTFVSTGGGDDPPASDADVASSDNGMHVYVVFEQDEEIMLAASHDGGNTWEEEIVTVSNTPGASTHPRVATSADGQIVHVAWLDTPGNGDVFYARSTNFGATFEDPRNLSNTSGRSDDLQLLTEGSNVYLVWVDFTNTSFGGEVNFKKSNNNGVQFSNNMNLSAGIGQSFQASRDPDMAAKEGGKVAVTWAAFPERNAVRQGDILVRESLDKGGTFNKHSNAANTPQTNSKEPQVDYIPGTVDEIYVAFLDAGGPKRVNTDTGAPNDPGAIYNVLATERDNSQRPFSKLTNLSDSPDNEFPHDSNSQLELNHDLATWDPSGSRG